jgi:glycosyltransferase involved in cell wall biosynthesis
VQRWVKFVKYLRDFGWEPVVYAPDGADYPLTDDSLAEEIPEGVEVLRRPIWEPYTWYNSFLGQKRRGQVNPAIAGKGSDVSLKKKVAVWLRGNVFIPDARVFWVRPSVRFLKRYLAEHPVDALVTTGPPHSMHLIGLKVSKAMQLPWIADFRDPWTKIEYHDDLMLTRRSRRKHLRLEKEVVRTADGISVVAPFFLADFQKYDPQRSRFIPNGYDESDFDAVEVEPGSTFTLCHAGTLAHDRNPTELWQALRELCDEVDGFRDDLEIKLLGPTDHEVKASLETYGLDKQVKDLGYVSHQEAIEAMKGSQVLLLLINRVAFNAPGRVTGKIFEYFAARRPILCIGLKPSDPAELIAECRAGTTCAFDDVQGTKEAVLAFYRQFRAGTLHIEPSGIEQFSRRNLTRQLATFLDEVTA